MRLFLTSILIVFLLVLSYSSYHKPEYNMDMVFYMGLVLSQENKTIEEVHQKTYQTAKDLLPGKEFSSITDSANVYRNKLYHDADYFHDQLKFYSVKPLFIYCVSLFYKLGFPLTKATVMPSIVAFILINMIFFFWIRSVVPDTFSFFISLSLALSSFMLDTEKLSTPDLLGALFLFSGAYFAIEKKWKIVSIFVFIISIFIRFDSFLFVCTILIYLFYLQQISLRQLLVIALLTIGVGLSIVLFQKTDISQYFLIRSSSERMLNGNNQSFLIMYLKGIVNGARSFMHSTFSFFIFLSAVILYTRQKITKEPMKDHLIVLLTLILIHCIVRFLIHPIIEDRFLIANYFLIVVIFLKSLDQKVIT